MVHEYKFICICERGKDINININININIHITITININIHIKKLFKKTNKREKKCQHNHYNFINHHYIVYSLKKILISNKIFFLYHL